MLAAVGDMCAARQVIEQEQAEISAGAGDELTLLALWIVRARMNPVVEVRARIRD
jgi:hypothetical protein